MRTSISINHEDNRKVRLVSCILRGDRGRIGNAPWSTGNRRRTVADRAVVIRFTCAVFARVTLRTGRTPRRYMGLGILAEVDAIGVHLKRHLEKVKLCMTSVA